MTKTRRTTDPRRGVGYIRVSTDRQKNGRHAERDAILAYARRQDPPVEIVAWAEDVAVSGGSPVASRPGFAAALDAIDKHGAGLLIVSRRDRFARDVVEAAVGTRLVEKHGARVVSTDTSNDDTPEAHLMRRIVDSFAEYERQIIKHRTAAALAARRARGLRFTLLAPFGFAWTRDGKMRRVPAQMATWARMKRLRSRGMSFRRIA